MKRTGRHATSRSEGTRPERRVRQALLAVRPTGLVAAAALSLPIWGLVFLFYAVLARGFGLGELAFAEAVFGAGLAVLANLLPVNGFAGFGPQDMGWVVGFASLGVPRELATTSALAVHLVYLFNIALFGLVGHLVLGLLGTPGARSLEGTRR